MKQASYTVNDLRLQANVAPANVASAVLTQMELEYTSSTSVLYKETNKQINKQTKTPDEF